MTMALRQSGYTIKPSGHNAPDEKRSYSEPDKKLAQAFERWLEKDTERDYNTRYHRALYLTEGLSVSVQEAHGLLVKYQNHPKINLAGSFVSAVYVRSPERNIVFDLDLQVPVRYIGHKLPEGKRLLNYATVGDELGHSAAGPVINFGEAGSSAGKESSEILVNMGEVGNRFGERASGIVVNFGMASDYMGIYASGMVINCWSADKYMGHLARDFIIALRDPAGFNDLRATRLALMQKDCEKIPKLAAYFARLRERLESGRDDYRAAFGVLDELGNEPAEKIRNDALKIITGSAVWIEKLPRYYLKKLYRHLF